MKKQLSIRATLLLIPFLAGLCSCEKTYDNPSSSKVNATVKITVSGVTAAEAQVLVASEQENITSLVYVPAIKDAGENFYLSMDAVARLAYVNEHGKKVDAPYINTESNLDPATSYSIAVIGLDKEGVVRTAPIFTTFKSETAITTVTADYVGEIEGKFKFSYTMTPNDYVKEYKYVVSNDPNVVKKTADEMKAYLIAGGSDVKKGTDAVSVEFDSDVKKDYVVATLSYDELGRPCSLSKEVASTENRVYFLYNGKTTEMSRISAGTDIFAGTFDVKASSTFQIKVNKDNYGFWSFSGNGGVGQNENVNTSSPYYYCKSFIEAKTHPNTNFFIRESLGRMQKMSAGGNALWVNEKADGKIYVKIDLAAGDNIPRYYVKWVEDKPNVVLEEYFDLCSYGAYYMIPYKANTSTLYPQGANLKFSTTPGFDGTIPGEKGAGNGTNIALYRSDWPSIVSEGAERATEVYMKNRGLQDWAFVNFSELSGAIAVGSGNFKGRATTPFLTKLTAATDITVEYETVGYGNNTDVFAIHIIGAGTFTACEATVEGVTTPITVTSDKKVVLPNGTIKKFATGENKVYTHIKSKVSGADATTRIVFAFDESTENNNASRSVFDNVVITK